MDSCRTSDLLLQNSSPTCISLGRECRELKENREEKKKRAHVIDELWMNQMNAWCLRWGRVMMKPKSLASNSYLHWHENNTCWWHPIPRWSHHIWNWTCRSPKCRLSLLTGHPDENETKRSILSGQKSSVNVWRESAANLPDPCQSVLQLLLDVAAVYRQLIGLCRRCVLCAFKKRIEKGRETKQISYFFLCIQVWNHWNFQRAITENSRQSATEGSVG